jgi:hypothetical protein
MNLLLASFVLDAFTAALVLLSYLILPIVLPLKLKYRYSIPLGSLFFALSYYVVEMRACSRASITCSAETHEIGIYITTVPIFGLIYCSFVAVLVRGAKLLIRYFRSQ